MTTKEFIQNYLKEVPSEFIGSGSINLVSKDTECYITIKSLSDEDNLIKFLSEREITILESTFDGDKKYPVANIGFSKKENKWYGWSHRAIYGFTIGSAVVFGDCWYIAPNKEIYEKKQLKFWAGYDEPYIKNGRIENRTEKGFDIVAEYTNDVPNKSLIGTIYSHHCKYPEQFGKGEWVAKTIEDAKQMAIDFANSVS